MRPEPQDGFPQDEQEAYDVCSECGEVECVCDQYDFENDGQPSEYDEWQDYYNGDDWDFGQYDDQGDY